MRRGELLIMLAESGSDDDLKRMIAILNSDPKRYVRSPDDPENLLNKKNK